LTFSTSSPFVASQRISYAKSTSHATIADTEGPEAVYAIKLGLRDAENSAANGGKLTVSAAQRKLVAEKKREREGDAAEEEEEEESEEEGGSGEPEKKKTKTAEKEVEEDDDGALLAWLSSLFHSQKPR
jgi:hypothetical protein